MDLSVTMNAHGQGLLWSDYGDDPPKVCASPAAAFAFLRATEKVVALRLDLICKRASYTKQRDV